MSGIFLPYQLKWINDDSPLKICEKGRREGVSWAESYRTALCSAASKQAGGMNTYYLSYNKAMTRQFVSDVAFFAREVLNLAAMGMQEVVIQNDMRDITMYRIVFDSGFEVVGMPSDAYNLRSKQGRIVLDEAAFCDDMEGVMKAAMALLIWGGQFSIISTHNGESSAFNTLIKEIRSGKQKKWSLHRVTFDDAIEQGLYKKICQKNGEVWSQEKQDAFVADIREIYADNIDEELYCVPRQSGERYFGRGLLDHATASEGSYDIRRLECSDSFLHKDDDYKNREVRKFFNQEVHPLLGVFESRLYVGNDFGRSGDLTTYWVAEEIEKTQLSVRLIVELKNAPFEQQQYFNDLLTDFLDGRGKLGGIAIDSRGNGQQISEHAMLRHPGAAVQVMETNAWYAKYGTDLHGLMESADFTVPDDEVIKADFGIVVLKNGIPTIPAVRTSDRDLKGKRHGDAASAAMLCVCAWRECAEDVPPSFTAAERKEKKFLWW
ncbi:MAG: hypothetical protein IJ558_04770 [Treponema sp.]|nr:hypothetical protein [Treponema sp.]